MTAQVALPCLPPHAQPEWLELTRATIRLEAAGHRPLCAAHPDQWDADADTAARAEAAEACTWCPLMKPCSAFATAADEQWHVWGGRDRTAHRTYRPRTTR